MIELLQTYRHYVPYVAICAVLGLLIVGMAAVMFGAAGALLAVAAFAAGSGMGAMIGDAIRYRHPHQVR
ncbi:hypothetical protein [Bradyrhizobium sp. SZCCHNRI1073]|uniref:hypothetical protein n=1 Tax=Bradyrhizobium sp. SZCCHNRI1073 TaxID=3057280 RepID=UPI0029164939|nr:hypothetical protein [Bradyrhizobium sp. SZCCHNRI1073]